MSLPTLRPVKLDNTDNSMQLNTYEQLLKITVSADPKNQVLQFYCSSWIFNIAVDRHDQCPVDDY